MRDNAASLRITEFGFEGDELRDPSAKLSSATVGALRLEKPIGLICGYVAGQACDRYPATMTLAAIRKEWRTI